MQFFNYFLQNIHPYVIPTVHEMKMDYMVMFKPYKYEVKNKFLDGLKKDLEGVTSLTSNGGINNDGDFGGNPMGVRIGDDASPSTSKVIVGTFANENLNNCVAVLEEIVLNISTYIK